ncbi:MAG: DUF2961 domain-containing protein [Verrucomicrobia bacterium]|nr:DUF2961 domain-containing protein [Verrucomicrobiota bacterium]
MDHLPELESSHTAMSSTWDRSGGNFDGWDFKRVEQGTNVLLDVAGPGCVHRMFTGWLGQGKDVLGKPGPAGTRIQVFLDRAKRPVFELPVEQFFDDRNGPFSYPLVFHKTYPGILFPIPFAQHCRVQLVNSNAPNWGNFWQLTYTTYAPEAKVKSLRWPLNKSEKEELGRVRQAWLEAESRPPSRWSAGGSPARSAASAAHAGEPPALRGEGETVVRELDVDRDKSAEVPLEGCGVIWQMRVSVWPPTPELLRGVRLQIRWDGAKEPSVDVPLGYFFGNADYGYANDIHFNSLLLGATHSEAYACFPMPFSRGAILRFENGSEQRAHRIRLSIDVEKRETLPAHWGRFHATWTEARAAQPDSPRFGPKNIPAHLALDRQGPGKYVGVLLHVAWPHPDWWGEGDWLIWTDEDAWPPSYHGTGSEEYFNSGWCSFDRKAVSGYIKTHPGEVSLYSFHLNDAFQFRRNIRVAEETFGMDGGGMKGDTLIHRDHPVWGSTVFWYASPPQPAGSTPKLIQPR